MIQISDKLINGTVAAQLTASLMAVSCITVTFCVKSDYGAGQGKWNKEGF